MNGLRLGVAILIMNAASPVGAAASVPAVQAFFRAVIEPSNAQSPAGRAEIIRASAVYCEAISHAYPRNSPVEDQWLDSEVRAGGQRMMRVLSSAEWGRRMAANFINACTMFAASYDPATDRARPFIGLAWAFTRFRPDVELLAKKNGVDSDALGLPGISPSIEGLLAAALNAQ